MQADGAPETIWGRISSLENDIIAVQKEFMDKYLKWYGKQYQLIDETEIY